MAYLELKDIRKSYYLGKEEFPVLKGINLEFELGEFVSILGESGGGKSTLMNIIGGLDREFEGQVIVNGKALDHSQEKRMDEYRRDEIGYIYQAYNLINHLTVLENVKLSLDMTTLSNQEREQRALDLLERVGLAEHAKKYPNQLSGGQKQRVAIARALSSDPKVIIADEPTGALDAENTEDVLKILDEIAAEGRLVIAVTHSQHVADAGTRIVHLAEGQIDGDERIRPAYPVDDANHRLTSKELSFAVSMRTAYKHFKFHFGRNLLIVIGTAIGLFAVMLFSGLGTGVNGYVNKQVTDLVNPKAVVVTQYQKGSSSSGGTGASQQQAYAQMAAGTSKTNFKTSDINKIKKLAHVSSVQKLYSATSVTVAYKGKQATAQSLSSWTSSNSNGTIKNGSKPGVGEVVLDKSSVAKNLTKSKAKSLIGKTVTLSYQAQDQSGNTVTVSFKAKVSGISSSQNSASYVNATTLTQAMRNAGVKPAATALAVKADSMNSSKTVVKEINRIKTNGERVFTATSVSSMISTIQTYIDLITNILAGIAAISLLVSALMIIVTMYMSVADRTKEIGILRALGESKRDIRRMFIAESLIIGIFSAVIATIVAFLAEVGANALLANIAKYDFIQIGFNHVILVFIIAIIISLLAAWLPARHAAALNPIDALAAD
ncbi:ATP-binding cassette domain-containing protein [Limosilactobacillus gastricus]|uniref:ABC transporter permease and ATP-binding component n=1 Tax=Limosilactobacillus gastricus DSM 16045 TaxID=1423749 RepID=A0A0R1VHC3_9LACO|nr:ABC transporter ATP-binding protein/permease [Limosilactobacillus gastricus]KRM02617.1 ABC transporter permease and ATP-binding component [Limosilactobacillus gastricus DSM 16045]QGF40686.1 ATP-binding cassette domain-containing protein [Limosilactobacillus gastricus]